MALALQTRVRALQAPLVSRQTHLGPAARRSVAALLSSSASHKQRRPAARAAQRSSRTADAPASDSSTSGSSGSRDAAATGPHVDCVATGLGDVQCIVSGEEEEQQQPAALPANGSTSGDSIHTHQHMDCVATGLDGVQCVWVDDEPQPAAGLQQQGEQQQQQQQLSSSSSPVPPAAPQQPRTAAAAAASGDAGIAAQLLGVALLISPFFFWGTSMVAMKPVTAHTTPLLLGAMRLLPAGAVLVAWAAATGRPQPKGLEAWAWVLAFALVDGVAFQGFLAEGLQRTTAGLGSVIIDSQPLSVALLAALLFGEALSPLGVAGLCIGVAGLLLLEVPPDVLLHGLPAGGDSGSGSSWSLTDSGEFWMLLAAQSMAVGTVMVRWVTKHCDPVSATAWHMLLGGALLGAGALAADGGSGELAARLALFDARDAAAMAYVSLLGGAAAYGIFFYEATHGSLTAISSLTFLTPVFAAAAGYAALGETLSPVQLLGASVTLGAVFAINSPASHEPGGAAKAGDGAAGRKQA